MEVAEKVFGNIVSDLTGQSVVKYVADSWEVSPDFDGDESWESSDEWEDSEC